MSENPLSTNKFTGVWVELIRHVYFFMTSSATALRRFIVCHGTKMARNLTLLNKFPAVVQCFETKF